jgi:hypothetical protein
MILVKGTRKGARLTAQGVRPMIISFKNLEL